MKADVEIRHDGPLGASYPVAWVGPDRAYVTRRYGSWLALDEKPGGYGLREPEALGIDCEDLQALPEVKRFDAEQRKVREDARAAVLALAVKAGRSRDPLGGGVADVCRGHVRRRLRDPNHHAIHGGHMIANPPPTLAQIIHAALEWAEPPHGTPLEARAVRVLSEVNVDVWNCHAHVVREREALGIEPDDFACRAKVSAAIIRAAKRTMK